MTITKRGTKGSALTYNEMDENIRDLYEDTTINRVFTNASGSGSDVQYLTYTPPSEGNTVGFITVTDNTRIRFPTTDAAGNSVCCEDVLDMKNHNIVGVNHLKFSDPGPGEGLEWSNIKIQESPDDLTTNTAGSLQILHKNTGTPTGGSATTTYERRVTVKNDHTEIRGQIQADSHQYVLVVSGEDKHNTINQTTNSGVGIKLLLANNSADGESFLGASIVARRESDSDDNSSTSLEFYTSHNDETLDKRIVIDSGGNVKIGVVGTNPKPLTVRSRYAYNDVANGGIRVDTYSNQLDRYTSISTIGGSNFSANCEYYGSNIFLPISTVANNIRMLDGHIIFCANSGLTANTPFTPTERARVTPSGNLLVGTTDNTPYNNTTGSGICWGGGTHRPNSIARESTATCLILNKTGTQSNSTHIQEFRYDGVGIGNVSISSTAVAFNTGSDERLKENITDSADAGSKVDAIQIRQFDWKADGSHQDYGLIAQELVTVAPEAVHQPVDEEDMMGVDYSKLVPMLIKEIQSLRVRLSTLENN